MEEEWQETTSERKGRGKGWGWPEHKRPHRRGEDYVFHSMCSGAPLEVFEEKNDKIRFLLEHNGTNMNRASIF